MTRDNELAKAVGQAARRKRAKGAAKKRRRRYEHSTKKADSDRQSDDDAPKFDPCVDDSGVPSMSLRGEQ